MEIELKPLPRKYGDTEQVLFNGVIIGILHFSVASGGRDSPFRRGDFIVCGTTKSGFSVGFHDTKDEIIGRLSYEHNRPKSLRDRRMDRRYRREAREEREDNREE